MKRIYIPIIIVALSLFLWLGLFKSRSINENNIRTFVINLERSPQRWNKISDQLQENGFVYERFNAVDGYLLEIVDDKGLKFSGLDIKNNPKLLLPNSHYSIHCPSENVEYYSDFSTLPRTLSAGEFGVYCSHREIWLKMVKENIPYALILEDDAQLKPNFRKQFLTNVKALPSDWDILYLFMMYYAEAEFYKKGGFSIVKNNIFLKKIVKNIRFATSTAYMINLPTAKLLIDTSKNFTWPIDHVMENTIITKKLGAYVIVPFPAIPSGESVIQEMFPSQINPR